jgi:DNA polymerase
MELVIVDFETRSPDDITTAGSTKYLSHRDSDIVCMGYKIGDGETQIWIPGHDLPYCVQNPDEFRWVAHNAQFDFQVWDIIGILQYDFPENPIDNWIDTMAICGRFTYPQALEKAGTALNLNVQKNPRGKYLIKRICCPPFEFTHTELFEFYEYCKDDVRTTYELLHALPASMLSDEEHYYWKLTCKINFTGLPIDIKAAKQIYKLTEIYKQEQNTLLPALTNGLVTKATQHLRITQWLRNKGVHTANLQAATVDKLLERVDLDDDVRTVLTLRKELGRSSTAKYLRIIEQEFGGRIYMNERYYGSNTGRWAGQGFQVKNLPRSKVKDAQPIIDAFMDMSIIEGDPIEAAKSIIRGMICAPKGKRIAAADYTSIENRLVAWVTEDHRTLQLFFDGLDQYIDMAVDLYRKPYDDINDEERYYGKVVVLGCGYGLGGKGFQGTAESFGILLEEEDAQAAVNTYRNKYPEVPKMWYACKNAAVAAVRAPGQPFQVKKVVYKVVRDRNKTIWLQCRLPSGRNLYYNQPSLYEDDFGVGVKAWGINPYTKQWMSMKILPGRFFENIVQALARDILASGMRNLDQAGYMMIGTVHDEIILEVPKNEDCLSDICHLMCKLPSWAKGLPLGAEGIIEKRYRKM